MSNRKKKKYCDINACIKPNDNFGTMFVSMCKHEAFKKLTLAERDMYMLCRVQAQDKNGRACLYNHAQEFGRQYNLEKCFTFPAKHLKEYGKDNSNARKILKKLIEKGFLEEIERNKYMQKVNVYAFSDKWKNTM